MILFQIVNPSNLFKYFIMFFCFDQHLDLATCNKQIDFHKLLENEDVHCSWCDTHDLWCYPWTLQSLVS